MDHKPSRTNDDRNRQLISTTCRTLANIKAELKVTGIYPINRDVLTKEEYLPSKFMDRQVPQYVPNYPILPIYGEDWHGCKDSEKFVLPG
jgi:hypothetical protein